MAESAKPITLDVPLSLVAPVQLMRKSVSSSCGLFFPYRTNLPMGLVVDWEGEAHLIHLDGPYAFKEGAVGIGNPIRGVAINNFQYRVDITSRYNSGEEFDPAGALVLKDGNLFLCCRSLGDQFHNDPHPVPVRKGFSAGSPEEACGFTRWSIVVQDGKDIKVIRSFDAQ